jgi:hypothetical protein
MDKTHSMEARLKVILETQLHMFTEVQIHMVGIDACVLVCKKPDVAVMGGCGFVGA